MIARAATTIRALSRPLEKYSALEWPKWWRLSAGLAARVRAQNAPIAATRFTPDSRASDSNPTEPVSRQAWVLSAIVATAAATETKV